MSSEVGALNLRITECKFERDVATFLTMNPKYVIIWKSEKIESEPAYDGGKTPSFSLTRTLDIGSDLNTVGVVNINFFDEEDLICGTEIEIKS